MYSPLLADMSTPTKAKPVDPYGIPRSRICIIVEPSHCTILALAEYAPALYSRQYQICSQRREPAQRALANDLGFKPSILEQREPIKDTLQPLATVLIDRLNVTRNNADDPRAWLEPSIPWDL